MGSGRTRAGRARMPRPSPAAEPAPAAAASPVPVPAALRPYFDLGQVPDEQTLMAFLSQRITEPTGIPFLATDRLGRVMMWSLGAAQVFGYDAAAAVGKLTLADFWPGREGEVSWEQALDRALHGTAGWVGVVTAIRSDGTAILVRLHVSAVTLHPGGGVKGFIFGGKDVTDQERHWRAVESDEARIRGLLDASPEPWTAVGLAGTMDDLNDAMAELCCRPRSDLIGAVFAERFAEDDRERARDVIRQVLRDGRVDGYELRLRDGGKTVRCAARILRDADRRPRGLIAALTDVSEAQRRDLALRDAKGFADAVLDTADGVIVVDRDGRLVDVSEHMCALAGLSRTELIGARFADLFADDELAREVLGSAAATSAGDDESEGGGVRDRLLRFTAGDGSVRHFSVNAGWFRPADGDSRLFVMVRDVTEQVAQQQATERGQAYNRGLIEAAVDGLMTVDFQGFIADVNSRICEMLGEDRDQVVGSEFTRCFTDVGRAHEMVHRALIAGEVVNQEMRLAGDPQTTVSVNASVFRDDAGEIAGVFVSARDITDQADLREKITAQQAYDRALIESTTEPFFAISPDGVITDVNGLAAELTGFSRKHLTGTSFSELFDDPADAERGVALAFDKGQVTDYGLVLTTGGRRRVVSFNAGVFRDPSGRPEGLLAAARDITAQVEMEGRLRAEQLHSRSLIEASVDALVTTDVTGQITDVNERMAALAGRPRGDLIGCNFSSCFTDSGPALDLVSVAVRDGSVTGVELTARRPGGDKTVVSCNASTFTGADGKLQGVFALLRDVTEQKSLEEMQRRMLDQARELDQAKTDFVSRVSLELRSPLTGILGYLELLQAGKPGQLNPEQERVVSIIERGGKRLLALIEDLLLLSRIEAGSLRITISEVELEPLIRDAYETFVPAISAAGLDCHLDIAPGIVLRADAGQLERLIANLLSNAVKFTQRGGRVEVRARREGARS